MTASLHVFPGYTEEARKLAAALCLPLHAIDLHRFPDGESRVKVQEVTGTAIIFASLDHPDGKIVPLLLAAAALRAGGADRLVLLCPYLCYMRQDKAFTPGEAVSQKVIGPLLAQYFDRVITVDPHLHRTPSLSAVMPGIRADTLSATALIGDLVAAETRDADIILVGPDSESRQWVAAVAAHADLPFLIAEKTRHGDREVDISLPEAGRVRGRRAVIIDDLISSGATICRMADLLIKAGAAGVEAVAVHVLADAPALDAMAQAGVARIRSSSSIIHATNAFSLTPLFVAALEEEIHHGH